MKRSWFRTVVALLMCLFLSACNSSSQKQRDKDHKIKVATLQPKAVTLTQQYVGQVRAHHHIEVRAPETGYLETVQIKEGQQAKKDDVLFRLVPILYQAALDAENAEAKVAQIELNGIKKSFEDKIVSQYEVQLSEAKLAKAQANVQSAAARLDFATIKAPFDGMVDRLPHQQGSLVQEGETLTTLSDNSLVWVYFNVPEARYLDYKSAGQDEHPEDLKIELVLANGKKFDESGKLGAIGADFNHETGNVPFLVDFPNPNRLLRQGQTGTVLVSRVQHDAIVVPQRATFESREQRFVYLVDEDDVAHERPIVIQNELDDELVVKSGLGAGDKIVIDGISLVRDGQKLEY
jgi:membrane fusion protein (multidrug efflux system)